MEKEKVGIGVTVHNRNEVFKNTYKQIKKYAPKNSVIVIVDDASTEPIESSDYRFEQNAGIARSKNKCIELLKEKGCTEIFLFDDDTYPIHPDWYKPYTESKYPHLMYIFTNCYRFGKKTTDITKLYSDSDIIAYSIPRGCMLYLNIAVLGDLASFDETFSKYGYEHQLLSESICNAGYTPYPFIDIHQSNKYIYSLDEHNEVKSSVDAKTKLREYNKHRAYFQNQSHSLNKKGKPLRVPKT